MKRLLIALLLLAAYAAAVYSGTTYVANRFTNTVDGITSSMQTNAVTEAEIADTKLGAERRDVRYRFGRPSRQTDWTSGQCLLYPIVGADVRDRIRFCFLNGRLVSKGVTYESPSSSP